MPLRRSRYARWAAALPVAMAVALVPVATATAAPHPGAVHVAARHAAGPALLTPAQAVARARATHKNVVVSSLTSPTRRTVASPNGEFTLTESLLPVRALRSGKWLALNPRLHRVASGRLVPQVTTRQVSLSDGGAGALAVLQNYGRTMTLTWPGNLPAPTVTGATATYHNVLPGVDLAVTITEQGDVSEDVIVRNAAAADNPGLAKALRIGISAPGMSVTADNGGVAIATGPAAEPTFVAPEAEMWDSAGPPAGTRTATVGGVTRALPSGMPAYSGTAVPGAFATTSQVPLSVSRSGITMKPSAGFLTGPGTVFPVYIDPGFTGVQYTKDASAWTQIDGGLPNSDGSQTSTWDETGSLSSGPLLQVGYCDPNNIGPCNGIGVTRSLFKFPLSGLPSAATVRSADIDLTDAWSADCDSEPLQLWTAPNITSSTDYNNSTPWTKEMEQLTFSGYGYPGCGYSKNDVIFGTGSTATGGSITTFVNTLTTAIDGGANSETFGIRAADESTTDGTAWLQWRQFGESYNGTNYITLSLKYSTPPTAPKITTTPGGACQGSSTAPVIGNDDITVTGLISDTDNDSGLTTAVTVYNSSNTSVDTFTYPASGQGTTPGTYTLGTIPRGTLTANGVYHLKAVTTDSFSETASTTCYFQLNLSAPVPPTVTGFPDSVSVGQPVTGVSFNPASGQNCAATPDPCPATYTYQIGNRAPVTVTANSSGVWTQPASSPITIPILGPFIVSVTGINSAGNPSQPTQVPVTSTLPVNSSGQTIAIPDGYYSDGNYPDLLTTNTAAKDASLWLSPGTSNGHVGTGIDIGGLGTGVNPGSDGPADWNGAAVLHGNFTGQYFQDVMAYNGANNGIIIQGTGNTGPISPYSGQVQSVTANDWCDETLVAACANASPTAPVPTDLVYAGNASEQDPSGATNGADVIGIWGSSSTGYELNLYTAFETGGYGLQTVLSSTQTMDSPDGTADWQDYSLATAELPDAAFPNGDPSDTVLLALDTQPGNAGSGKLYESVNPGCASGTCSATTLIGMPGTWTLVTGTPASWATSAPTLISADVNNGSNGPGSGALEVWTGSGSTATAYTITGSTPTATAEGSGSSLSYPTGGSWALNDGGANPNQTVTTATDSVTGTHDPITGSSYSWAADDTFGTVLDTNASGASNTFVTPAATIVATTDAEPTISLWFQTTDSAGGVLASLQSAALSSGTTSVSNYDPVLYIGNDGKLHAEWWNGGTHPISSTSVVDDGLWHHVVLSTTTSGSTITETLTIDGQVQATMTGAVNLASTTSGLDTNLTFGDGYIGGEWPDEPNYVSGGGNGTPGYFFNGEMADITYSNTSTANVQNTATPSTCLDANSNDYPNNGDSIQMWSCATTAEQQWQVTTAGQLENGLTGLCLDANSNDYPNNGDSVQLWSCNTNGEQQWHFTTAGQLENAQTGMCLDANSSNYPNNGDNIQLWSCNTNAEQVWAFDPGA